jgi:hypothetical protein
VRGRLMPALLTCTGTPFIIVIVIAVLAVAVVPGGVPRGGSGVEGACGISMTFARRIGDPVSAATTRPRMIPVPVGSGRRTTSRG